MALLERPSGMWEGQELFLQPESMEVAKNVTPDDITAEILNTYPTLRPVFLEIASCDFLQHGLSVAAVYNNVLSLLNVTGHISPNTHLKLKNYTLGAALHDIGKMGIVEGDIISSIETMNEHPQPLLTSSQEDLRSPSQIARQQLHAAVGGYALTIFGTSLSPGQPPVLSQTAANHHAQIPFRHHEAVLSDDMADKSSYPRLATDNGNDSNHERREKLNPRDSLIRDFAAYLVELCDFAVSMREDRPYRMALSEPVIRRQLEILLTDKTIRHFLPLIRVDGQADKIKEGSIYPVIRNSLADNIILNTYQIDPLLRIPLNKKRLFGPQEEKGDSKPLNQLNPYTDTPLLVEIFGRVWKNHAGRLIGDFERFYREKHFHKFRNSY